MKTKKKEKEDVSQEIETVQTMNCYFKEQRDFCNAMIKEGEKQLGKLRKRK